MGKLLFTLYGLLMGAIFSVFGSLFFSLTVALLTFGTKIFSSMGLYIFGSIGLLSVTYSAIPCALAGAYCAYWLASAERTAQEVARRGKLIGALAGFIISLAAIWLIFALDMNWALFGLTLLAMLFTSIFGRIGAKFLARRLARQSVTEVATTTTKPTSVG